MSKLKIHGNDNGTGTIIITSPSYAPTNQTIELPHTSGQLVTSSQDLIPNLTDTYDLGSADRTFREIFVSANTIFIGGTEIKASATGIVLSEITIGSGANSVKLAASPEGKLKQTGTTDSGASIPEIDVPQSLTELGDVNYTTTTVADNQVLRWNETTSNWEASTDLIRNFSDFADVDVTTTPPTGSKVLSWNNSNSEWNSTPDFTPINVQNASELLALTGMPVGQIAIVAGSNRNYIYAGSVQSDKWRYAVSGWYVAEEKMTNHAPSVITGISAGYTLQMGGSAKIITLLAQDPDDMTVTWSHVIGTPSGGRPLVSVTTGNSHGHVGNVFTITPVSGIDTTSAGEQVDITFKAVDDTLPENAIVITRPFNVITAAAPTAITANPYEIATFSNVGLSTAIQGGVGLERHRFGSSVKILDDFYVISSPYAAGLQGAAYIYPKDTTISSLQAPIPAMSTDLATFTTHAASSGIGGLTGNAGTLGGGFGNDAIGLGSYGSKVHITKDYFVVFAPQFAINSAGTVPADTAGQTNPQFIRRGKATIYSRTAPYAAVKEIFGELDEFRNVAGQMADNFDSIETIGNGNFIYISYPNGHNSAVNTEKAGRIQIFDLEKTHAQMISEPIGSSSNGQNQLLHDNSSIVTNDQSGNQYRAYDISAPVPGGNEQFGQSISIGGPDQRSNFSGPSKMAVGANGKVYIMSFVTGGLQPAYLTADLETNLSIQGSTAPIVITPPTDHTGEFGKIVSMSNYSFYVAIGMPEWPNTSTKTGQIMVTSSTSSSPIGSSTGNMLRNATPSDHQEFGREAIIVSTDEFGAFTGTTQILVGAKRFTNTQTIPSDRFRVYRGPVLTDGVPGPWTVDYEIVFDTTGLGTTASVGWRGIHSPVPLGFTGNISPQYDHTDVGIDGYKISVDRSSGYFAVLERHFDRISIFRIEDGYKLGTIPNISGDSINMVIDGLIATIIIGNTSPEGQGWDGTLTAANHSFITGSSTLSETGGPAKVLEINLGVMLSDLSDNFYQLPSATVIGTGGSQGSDLKAFETYGNAFMTMPVTSSGIILSVEAGLGSNAGTSTQTLTHPYDANQETEHGPVHGGWGTALTASNLGGTPASHGSNPNRIAIGQPTYSEDGFDVVMEGRVYVYDLAVHTISAGVRYTGEVGDLIAIIDNPNSDSDSNVNYFGGGGFGDISMNAFGDKLAVGIGNWPNSPSDSRYGTGEVRIFTLKPSSFLNNTNGIPMYTEELVLRNDPQIPSQGLFGRKVEWVSNHQLLVLAKNFTVDQAYRNGILRVYNHKGVGDSAPGADPVGFQNSSLGNTIDYEIILDPPAGWGGWHGGGMDPGGDNYRFAVDNDYFAVLEVHFDRISIFRSWDGTKIITLENTPADSIDMKVVGTDLTTGLGARGFASGHTSHIATLIIGRTAGPYDHGPVVESTISGSFEGMTPTSGHEGPVRVLEIDLTNADIYTSTGSSNVTMQPDATPYILSLNSIDPEGGDITWSYAVTSGSLINQGGVTATVSQSGSVFTIVPTTNLLYTGSFSITFTATDASNGLTTDKVVNFTIPNAAISAITGVPSTIGMSVNSIGGDTATFTAAATDPDGGNIAWSYYITSTVGNSINYNQRTGSVNGGTRIFQGNDNSTDPYDPLGWNGTFTLKTNMGTAPKVPHNYILNVTATDGVYTETSSCAVNVFNVPTSDVTGVPSNVNLSLTGSPTVITAYSSDPDNGTLTWSYQVEAGGNQMSGISVTNINNIFTITPQAANTEQTFTLRFKVSDGFVTKFADCVFSLAYPIIAGGSAVFYETNLGGERYTANSPSNVNGTPYTWTCPANVYSVHALCVGGGAKPIATGVGGGGGGLGWKNNIPVTPGQSYSLMVGRGGEANSNAHSWFVSTSTVIGRGGSGKNGGGFQGDGGGSGGSGTSGSAFGDSGNGGGAGGYSGNGGDAAEYYTGNGHTGSGGAGGGGHPTAGGHSAGGGGVGINGAGSSGGSLQGGSGGQSAQFGGTGHGSGGDFGGGGSGGNGGNSGDTGGGDGVVKLIWGTGAGAPLWPSTNIPQTNPQFQTNAQKGIT